MTLSNALSIVMPIMSAVMTLVGLGVLWGALRTQVEFLRVEVTRLTEHLNRQDTLLSSLQEEVRVKFAALPASSSRKRRK